MPRTCRTYRIAALALVAALAAVGCGGAEDTKGGDSASASSGGGDGQKLSLVAYSTPEVVYDEIIPAFRNTSAGKGTSFRTSFGASGEQSRAVEAGLKADVVSFSIEPDVDRVVDAGLVSKDWKKQTSTNGLVSKSIVSFIVRKGNPKHIKTWDDLLKPGVKVVTPNPFTSGAAKWNLLGAVAHGGVGYVQKLIKDHVSVQPKSGREALQTFTGGEGDVLLSYEYEATTAIKKGEEGIELVRPDSTVEIEIDIARTKDASPAAKQFIDYVLGPEGQSKFVAWGYRPVDPETAKRTKSQFPDPPKVTTIDDLGGWSKVNDELFDPENGKIAKIEEDAGVSTAK
jgi:sulfate/thiosulfate transport system substrate-binding protein